VSWSSPEAFSRILTAFAENLRRFVAGDALEGVVHVELGY
jgi:hypothetical protein